jgi:hypothetical protein
MIYLFILNYIIFSSFFVIPFFHKPQIKILTEMLTVCHLVKKLRKLKSLYRIGKAIHQSLYRTRSIYMKPPIEFPNDPFQYRPLF